jgi:poly-gamma-glutamate synthesis protein (capsule biosynthesis protein)
MPRSFEATASEAGVAWSEDEQVVADIRKARTESGADLVIPFMHWETTSIRLHANSNWPI